MPLVPRTARFFCSPYYITNRQGPQTGKRTTPHQIISFHIITVLPAPGAWKKCYYEYYYYYYILTMMAKKRLTRGIAE